MRGSIMATIIHERLERDSFEGLRVSWGGIWSGVLVVMGTLLLLTALGVAIGVSAADPRDTEAGTLGTVAAAWTALSILIALFFGGMAATRLGAVLDRTTGVLEGALVWVLSILAILYLASSGVQLVAGGLSTVFGGVTRVVQSAVTNVDDLSAGDVNQVLARLRDPQTARTLSSATGVPEQEVRTTLNDIAQRVEAARNDPARVAQEVREGTRTLMDRVRAQLPATAERVQDAASKTAWFTFAALVISLLAAVGGSMLGRRRVAMRIAEGGGRTTVVETDLPPRE
jgi:hypothetical protein